MKNLFKSLIISLQGFFDKPDWKEQSGAYLQLHNAVYPGVLDECKTQGAGF
jgi:hypothetical protein